MDSQAPASQASAQLTACAWSASAVRTGSQLCETSARQSTTPAGFVGLGPAAFPSPRRTCDAAQRPKSRQRSVEDLWPLFTVLQRFDDLACGELTGLVCFSNLRLGAGLSLWFEFPGSRPAQGLSPETHFLCAGAVQGGRANAQDLLRLSLRTAAPAVTLRCVRFPSLGLLPHLERAHDLKLKSGPTVPAPAGMNPSRSRAQPQQRRAQVDPDPNPPTRQENQDALLRPKVRSS